MRSPRSPGFRSYACEESSLMPYSQIIWLAGMLRHREIISCRTGFSTTRERPLYPPVSNTREPAEKERTRSVSARKSQSWTKEKAVPQMIVGILSEEYFSAAAASFSKSNDQLLPVAIRAQNSAGESAKF